MLGPVDKVGADSSEEVRIVIGEEMIRRLEMLRMEHRDFDTAIVALTDANVPDQMAIARLKKRKLRLRDEINWIEDQLVPDIIA